MVFKNYLSYTTREDVTKKIMPNRCDLCGIGIGHSMLYFESTWRPYNHLNDKVYYFNWIGGRLKVCFDCLQDLEMCKDVENYIKKTINQYVRK